MDPINMIKVESRTGTTVDTEACRKELFSMKLRTCIFTDDGMEIHVTELSNVLSYSCICSMCGIYFAEQSSIGLHMETHLQNEEELSDWTNNTFVNKPGENSEFTMMTGDFHGHFNENVELSEDNYDSPDRGNARADNMRAGDEVGESNRDEDGEASGNEDGEASGVEDGDASGVENGEVSGDEDGEVSGDKYGESIGDEDGEAIGDEDREASGDEDGEASGDEDGEANGDEDCEAVEIDCFDEAVGIFCDNMGCDIASLKETLPKLYETAEPLTSLCRNTAEFRCGVTPEQREHSQTEETNTSQIKLELLLSHPHFQSGENSHTEEFSAGCVKHELLPSVQHAQSERNSQTEELETCCVKHESLPSGRRIQSDGNPQTEESGAWSVKQELLPSRGRTQSGRTSQTEELETCWVKQEWPPCGRNIQFEGNPQTDELGTDCVKQELLHIPPERNIRPDGNPQTEQLRNCFVRLELLPPDFYSQYKKDAHSPLEQETADKPYVCQLCGIRYRRQCSLDVHSRRHIRRDLKPVKKRGKKRNNKRDQKRDQLSQPGKHKNIHTRDKKSKKIPVEHKIRENKCSRRKRFVDHRNERKYRIMNASRIHNRIHREYPCLECDKQFLKGSQLKNHINLCHGRDKLYSCFICCRNFDFKIRLEEHIEVHAGEKRHLCTLCGKRFWMLSNLERHDLIHTGKGSRSDALFMA